jgi:hypothetical protein
VSVPGASFPAPVIRNAFDAARSAPPPVTVLLAVYNGDRFLQAQLDSLLAQTHAEWRLLWRDDGSSDGSTGIMESFAANQPAGRVRQLQDGRGHLGSAGSFAALLKAAPPGDAIAFCDQDDIWLPEKLARGLHAVQAEPGPAMHCARQRIVDADLQPLGLSPPAHRRLGLRNALVQNMATGCTTILNAEAARRLAALAAPPGVVFDWWCYAALAALGARISYGAEPTLLYRQHGGNQVGASASHLVRLRHAFTAKPGAFLIRAAALWRGLAAQAASFDTEARRLALAAAELPGLPGPRRLLAARRLGLHRQTVAEDLALALILLGACDRA